MKTVKLFVSILIIAIIAMISYHQGKDDGQEQCLDHTRTTLIEHWENEGYTNQYAILLTDVSLGITPQDSIYKDIMED